MKINWNSLQRRYRIDIKKIDVYVRKAAGFLKLNDYEANIIFVGGKKIRELNKIYYGKGYQTDVLSFSVDLDYLGDKFLGDVYICIEEADKQANYYKHSLTCELVILALHGILHLLGYDHTTDKGEMNLIEDKIRKKIGCPF